MHAAIKPAVTAVRDPPIVSVSICLVFVVAALLLRAASFGDPVANIDDQFYLLVGDRMHHGLLPYVDIWDRKPPGIFAIYWLIAAVSTAPAFYQFVAALLAAATAAMVAAIALRWTGRVAAILAGLIYLVMLGSFFGNSGQTAVFYNLPVAVAGCSRLASLDRARFPRGLRVFDRHKQQSALKPGGVAIIGTFAPDGPEKCSGLPVACHDAASIGNIIGPGFTLIDERRYDHPTPSGSVQKFQFSCFRKV